MTAENIVLEGRECRYWVPRNGVPEYLGVKGLYGVAENEARTLEAPVARAVLNTGSDSGGSYTSGWFGSSFMIVYRGLPTPKLLAAAAGAGLTVKIPDTGPERFAVVADGVLLEQWREAKSMFDAFADLYRSGTE